MAAVRNGKGKAGASPLKLRESDEAKRDTESLVHLLHEGIRCGTEKRGHETRHGKSPTRIVLDASEGFIPLWANGTTLRWRFQERSLLAFSNPKYIKTEVETLMGEALLAWGDAAPVKFSQKDDAWDFEVVVKNGDDCDINGCVLASAFFPDPGQHELVIYPKMFSQSRKEQVDTLVHEIGHVFGLRHFFANISEKAWPSEIYGTHKPFSIMNYGALSELTDADRDDLRRLYWTAWRGEITEINGTPIRLVKPFHTLAELPEKMVGGGSIQPVDRTNSRLVLTKPTYGGAVNIEWE